MAKDYGGETGIVETLHLEITGHPVHEKLGETEEDGGQAQPHKPRIENRDQVERPGEDDIDEERVVLIKRIVSEKVPNACATILVSPTLKNTTPVRVVDRTCSNCHIATMATIGLIGAGHIGSQIARAALKSGYDVVLSNSRGPETLSALIAELGPKARAATPAEAARAADIAVVTVPLEAYRSVPVEPLAGKIVIDTNNYYPQRDGRIPELDNESTTTSELLQAHLPTSKVVKAFNHIYASQITTDGRPAGTPNRRALVIAGNDAEAKKAVTRLLDQLGFDTVDAGPLKEGWRIQRDTPGYGPRRTADELRKDLAAAKRYAEM